MCSRRQVPKKQAVPKLRQAGEKPTALPTTREELTRKIDKKMQSEAEKLFPEFSKQLTEQHLSKFIKERTEDQYVSYREWNKEFLEDILGLKELRASDQRIRVMALQLFLHSNVGGFDLSKTRGRDSIDGMLGPFTLGKMNEYCKSLPKVAEPNKPKPAEPVKPSAPATQKTPEVLSRLAAKEKFNPQNIFYTGDSYMNGILGRQKVNRPNKRALDSSHLVRTRRYDTKKWRHTHIFIEEEALKFLERPDCKLLVVNGGVNDLYTRGPTNKTAAEIMNTFKKIIDAAHAKGVKIAVYTLNTRRPFTKQSDDMKKTIVRANKLTAEINNWLEKKSGADIVINTDDVLKGRLNRFGLHATDEGYNDLYATLQKAVQPAQA